MRSPSPGFEFGDNESSSTLDFPPSSILPPRSDSDFDLLKSRGHVTWSQRHTRDVSDSSKMSSQSSKSYRRFSVQPGMPEEERPTPQVGLEPGINTNTTTVQLTNAVGSEVTIVDYSPSNIKVSSFELDANYSKARLMESHLVIRPSWSQVRWININGLSWEAIEPIANFYELHPLAIEDMLDIPQRTKLDVYPQHIFCCFPMHLLNVEAYKQSRASRLIHQLISPLIGRKTDSPDMNRLRQAHSEKAHARRDTEFDFDVPASAIRQRLDEMPRRSMYQWDRGDNSDTLRYEERVTMKQPLSHQQATVVMEQVSIFMNENTVITFFERSCDEVMHPIMQRLRSEPTLLRQTSDPAILVQAIIDACVDLIEPIIAEYRMRLSSLQVDAVLNPTLSMTRALHLLMTDLTVLRNTVNPITLLVNSFRNKSPDKRLESGLFCPVSTGDGESTGRSTSSFCSYEKKTFNHIISDTAALYFGDVADHASDYTQHIELMCRHADSMSTLIFNTISIRSNDAVRLLSLVAVIFLPLTFLTGYFGMNFTQFASLNNGVDYYWAIAAPFSAGLLVVLMYNTIIDVIFKTYQWSKSILFNSMI